MPRASDLRPEGHMSFLFKGPFGHGKTIAACSFALQGRLYLAYWDKKTPIELKTYYETQGEDGKRILDNIEWDRYSSQNAHHYLNRLIEFTKDCRESTIVTDSVTNMTASAVGWSLGFRDSKAKKDKVNKDAPQIMADFDEYKIETGFIAQALDLSKTLPANMIWIAHPLPQLRVEGSGASMKVSKAVSLVTYGSKVAGMIPGSFTEIYHFSKKVTFTEAGAVERFVVDTRGIGDDFGKTAIFSKENRELDFTDGLFYRVWQETLDKQNKQPQPTQEEPQPTNNNIQFHNPFNTEQPQQTNTPKWRV